MDESSNDVVAQVSNETHEVSSSNFANKITEITEETSIDDNKTPVSDLKSQLAPTSEGVSKAVEREGNCYW